MFDNEKLSDEQLCALSAKGEREAEELLVGRYSKLVRMCARPYFLAGGDSEDLIQEGMIGLISAIKDYTADRSSFRTYAELCIRRRIYTAIQAATRYKHSPLNNSVSWELLKHDENRTRAVREKLTQRDPEDLLIARESADEIIKTSAGSLSALETEILGLYLLGLSYQEIAAEINKSTKSVDNAVQRIRRKLGRQINHGDIS